jgi:hypothetical protein
MQRLCCHNRESGLPSSIINSFHSSHQFGVQDDGIEEAGLQQQCLVVAVFRFVWEWKKTMAMVVCRFDRLVEVHKSTYKASLHVRNLMLWRCMLCAVRCFSGTRTRNRITHTQPKLHKHKTHQVMTKQPRPKNYMTTSQNTPDL